MKALAREILPEQLAAPKAKGVTLLFYMDSFSSTADGSPLWIMVDVFYLSKAGHPA